MIANVVLDYTEWAPPLYISAIRRDIDAYESQAGRTPSKIIMWVHHWEYLAAPRPTHVVDTIEFDRTGLKALLRPPESSAGGRLFGIPVEVRDPEAHKP